MSRLKWTIEVEVDESWVEAGFDLTDADALALLQRELPDAEDDEIAARVVGRPSEFAMAHAHGEYPDGRPIQVDDRGSDGWCVTHGRVPWGADGICGECENADIEP